ncbi:hypothetical protein V5O48_005366 [Marasmius crinis-equi]|uniref:Peptide hydrolase n=1 Tax=Marasmius crinis-equi TaxID=585013 RepID=A0ABR3FMJ2_9AGAR
MIPSTILLLAFAVGALGHDENSVRTIKFASQHVEKLPASVIEGLRFAPALPRPLSTASLGAVRASLANITSATGTTISDEAIDVLQGRHERKLWTNGFIDITGRETYSSLRARQDAPQFPNPDPSAHPELAPMLAKVTASELKTYVTELSTAWSSRYYLSVNASAPAAWIQSQFASWLGDSQVKAFPNPDFDQPNIVARIEAKSGSPDTGIVVLGAHLDSTSFETPRLTAPGADDDASGISAIMAIMRILKESGYQGSYAIEAHAYAGEEGGLLGSAQLAQNYKTQGKAIRGLLDFEMIGKCLILYGLAYLG